MPAKTPQPSRIEARRAISPSFNLGYTMGKALIELNEMQAGFAAVYAEHQSEIAAAESEYLRRQAIEIESSTSARNERCFAHDLDKVVSAADDVNDQNEP